MQQLVVEGLVLASIAGATAFVATMAVPAPDASMVTTTLPTTAGLPTPEIILVPQGVGLLIAVDTIPDDAAERLADKLVLPTGPINGSVTGTSK